MITELKKKISIQFLIWFDFRFGFWCTYSRPLHTPLTSLYLAHALHTTAHCTLYTTLFSRHTHNTLCTRPPTILPLDSTQHPLRAHKRQGLPFIGCKIGTSTDFPHQISLLPIIFCKQLRLKLKNYLERKVWRIRERSGERERERAFSQRLSGQNKASWSKTSHRR